MIVNGKEYPVWGQFVENKDKFIGGELEDFGTDDPIERALCGFGSHITKIVDIVLEPNGDNSAWFAVIGENFRCGFDVKFGAIRLVKERDGWIPMSGYMGHKWRFRPLQKVGG